MEIMLFVVTTVLFFGYLFLIRRLLWQKCCARNEIFFVFLKNIAQIMTSQLFLYRIVALFKLLDYGR